MLYVIVSRLGVRIGSQSNASEQDDEQSTLPMAPNTKEKCQQIAKNQNESLERVLLVPSCCWRDETANDAWSTFLSVHFILLAKREKPSFENYTPCHFFLSLSYRAIYLEKKKVAMATAILLCIALYRRVPVHFHCGRW